MTMHKMVMKKTFSKSAAICLGLSMIFLSFFQICLLHDDAFSQNRDVDFLLDPMLGWKNGILRNKTTILKSNSKTISLREDKCSDPIISALEKERAGFLLDFEKRRQQYFADKSIIAKNGTETVDLLVPSKFFVELDSESLDTTDATNKHYEESPWFILHIGPPKTATTTIQCGLEKHALRLAKTDRYHYLGGGCGVPNKEYVMPNGEEVFLRRSLIIALQDRTAMHSQECRERADAIIDHESRKHQLHLWKFMKRIRYLRYKGRSVILSGEQFGSQLSFTRRVMQRVKFSIMSSLSSSPSRSSKYDPLQGFAPDRVRIVLAYRHFVDWLPSFYYQSYLHLDSIMDLKWLSREKEEIHVIPFLEYAENYLTSWENYQQEAKEYHPGMNQTNPNLILIRRTKTQNRRSEPAHSVLMLPKNRQAIHPTWWLYMLWSSYFSLPNQVQVYDMHSPMKVNRPNEDMTTDFICHMLPTATRTCNTLKAYADAKPKTGIENQIENMSTKSRVHRFDIIDYENNNLHSSFSYLHPNRTEEKLGFSGTAVNQYEELKSESTRNDHLKQEIVIRPSFDHHATRIVEALLVRGAIQRFQFEEYSDKYFQNVEGRTSNAATDPVSINGYTKPMLVQSARNILEDHGILPSNSPSSSFKEEFYSDQYFDCMSPELEDRFLNASRTFMELMYRHMPMLSSTTVATVNSNGNNHDDRSTNVFELEKEKRWIEAKAEHERLFKKNKARGKYCDINPQKVFREHPDVYDELVSLKYKPSFRKVDWKDLPDWGRQDATSLGFHKANWKVKKRAKIMATRWSGLSSKEKASAFRLGWDELIWDRTWSSIVSKTQKGGN